MKNTINKYIESVLVGCILGDSYIGRSGDKSFITFEQTVKHETYVKFLHNLLEKSKIDVYDIKYYSRLDNRYNKINKSIYFKTRETNKLNYLSTLFLTNVQNNVFKKTIPIDIKTWLTPIAIAHWICGDGQLVKDGGITLCTDSYKKQEVELLITSLSERYGLDCSIHFKKSKNLSMYHRLYIKKKSFNEIKPLIKEFVHPSFLYKLHM